MAIPMASNGSIPQNSFTDRYSTLASLTCVLYDHLLTLQEEDLYMWQRKMHLGKLIFLWIRYYTIALLLFDVVQTFVLSRPGFSSSSHLCTAMECIIRLGRAISLWSIQGMMQIRIYALYRCSKPLFALNFLLFLASIGGFVYPFMMSVRRNAECNTMLAYEYYPSYHDSHGGRCCMVKTNLAWMQWLSATIYEVILFLFTVFKFIGGGKNILFSMRSGMRTRCPVYAVILRGNVMWFFGTTILLVINTLMCSKSLNIPWIGYAPYYAAMSILTTRMLLSFSRNFYRADVQIDPGGSDLHCRGRKIYQGELDDIDECNCATVDTILFSVGRLESNTDSDGFFLHDTVIISANSTDLGKTYPNRIIYDIHRDVVDARKPEDSSCMTALDRWRVGMNDQDALL